MMHPELEGQRARIVQAESRIARKVEAGTATAAEIAQADTTIRRMKARLAFLERARATHNKRETA